MEWQPIETAPRQTKVLAFCPERGVVVASYSCRKTGFKGLGVKWAWWQPGIIWEVNPTHWMPLPQPPQQEAKAHEANQNPRP